MCRTVNILLKLELLFKMVLWMIFCMFILNEQVDSSPATKNKAIIFPGQAKNVRTPAAYNISAYADAIPEGSACSLDGNQEGKCNYYFLCDTLPKAGTVNICGWSGFAAIVCCPTNSGVVPKEKEMEEGSACIIDRNQKGTCKTIKDCRSLREPTLIVQFCSETNFLVCCPPDTGDSGSVFDQSKQNRTAIERTDIYNQRFKGPECLTRSGPKAFCEDMFNCKNYPEGRQFYVCDWTDYSPRVCCFDFEKTDTSISSHPVLKSYQEEGSACDVSSNEKGTCELVVNCKTYPQEGLINVCGWAGSMPIICCAELVPDQALNASRAGHGEVFKKKEIECGFKRNNGYKEYFELIGGKDTLLGIYILNKTFDSLRTLDYSLHITKMNADAIEELHAQKNGRKFVYIKKMTGAVAPAGGRNAARERSEYMASLGAKYSDEIKWLCDGTVLNSQWVISAAHCFVGSAVEPNLIRLGIYTHGEPGYIDSHDYQDIEDFGLAEVVFHPDFVNPQRYHDIVLIRLSRPIPYFDTYITPICLPWKSPTEKDKMIEGTELTLTGWGATKYLGDKTETLQEVNLTVFHTAVCDASYSTLSDYDTKWPEGMDPSRTLCAGSVEGGKDACKGDSGGPLAYEDDSKRFTLAGIVSGGYGCGLKDFPGIYIPIRGSEYLDWIKRVAFT